MLTDEELTTRLSAAFHGVPDLTYAGPVPRVRRGATGIVATSAVGVAAALALAPAALQHDHLRSPGAAPGTGTSHQPGGKRVVHTLRLGSVRLTYATTGTQGRLFFELGPNGGEPPADAQEVDLGITARVWFVPDPGDGDPQVYVRPDGSAMTYGIYGQGWTHQELVDLLQHPVSVQESPQHRS